jgi:rhodanese-related sulfurtransferase
MKELNRTDRLTIASLIVAVIFLAGYFTIRKPEVQYSRSVAETIPLVITAQDLIYPEDVAVISASTDNGYFIVDLRSPVEFRKSHIGNAVNIAIQSILSPENQKAFDKLAEDSIIVILYSDDQLQANSAWIILKQLSFDNVRVMPGGFNYYSTSSLDLYDLPEIPVYMVEEPKYDFWGVLDSLTGQQSSGNVNVNAPEPVQVIKKEKKSQAEGGC